MGDVIRFPKDMDKLNKNIHDKITSWAKENGREDSVEYMEAEARKLIKQYFKNVEYSLGFSLQFSANQNDIDAAAKQIDDCIKEIIFKLSSEKASMLWEILIWKNEARRLHEQLYS